MDFGKVTDDELNNIDFTLPPDPAVTTEILNNSTHQGDTKFYIGCAKWGRKDWIGKLYPEGTKEKDFFQHYARQFNSIEFNAVAYKLPTKEQVRGWKSKVDENFLFCAKFTQFITHIKRLKVDQHDLNVFFDIMSGFGKNLGPFFLLPHPQMNPRNLETIKLFIAELPIDISVFLELRHDDWYGIDGYNKDLYAFLRNRNRGTVITDAAGRRDCVHMHLSTPECFIRFVGNSLHPTDYKRIDDWVQRIKQWMDQGLQTCYFFMHQHEELHSPELIKYFIQQMNTHCGTNLTPPGLEGSALLS